MSTVTNVRRSLADLYNLHEHITKRITFYDGPRPIISAHYPGGVAVKGNAPVPDPPAYKVFYMLPAGSGYVTMLYDVATDSFRSVRIFMGHNAAERAWEDCFNSR